MLWYNAEESLNPVKALGISRSCKINEVSKLMLFSYPYFNSCEKKTEFHSSLLLVLDELDNNYSYMRMKINMGIPLKELPPLSVELKFSLISSFYMPSKVIASLFYVFNTNSFLIEIITDKSFSFFFFDSFS